MLKVRSSTKCVGTSFLKIRGETIEGADLPVYTNLLTPHYPDLFFSQNSEGYQEFQNSPLATNFTNWTGNSQQGDIGQSPFPSPLYVFSHKLIPYQYGTTTVPNVNEPIYWLATPEIYYGHPLNGSQSDGVFFTYAFDGTKQATHLEYDLFFDVESYKHFLYPTLENFTINMMYQYEIRLFLGSTANEVNTMTTDNPNCFLLTINPSDDEVQDNANLTITYTLDIPSNVNFSVMKFQIVNTADIYDVENGPDAGQYVNNITQLDNAINNIKVHNVRLFGTSI